MTNLKQTLIYFLNRMRTITMSKLKQTAMMQTYSGMLAGRKQENKTNNGTIIIDIPKDILYIQLSSLIFLSLPLMT